MTFPCWGNQSKGVQFDVGNSLDFLKFTPVEQFLETELINFFAGIMLPPLYWLTFTGGSAPINSRYISQRTLLLGVTKLHLAIYGAQPCPQFDFGSLG